jgi:hypothetical protein
METVARRKIDRNTNNPTYSTAYFSWKAWKAVRGGRSAILHARVTPL